MQVILALLQHLGQIAQPTEKKVMIMNIYDMLLYFVTYFISVVPTKME